MIIELCLDGENVKINDRLYNDKALKSVANDKYKKLYDSLQRMFPDLDDIDVEYCFNGTLGTTKDMLPIIDEVPNMPNIFCCLGFGANGVLFGNIGGKILKDAVKGYFTKDMQMFKLGR